MKTEKQESLSPIINGKVIQPPRRRLVEEAADTDASASPETDSDMSQNQAEIFDF